jgi:hypothetical protein
MTARLPAPAALALLALFLLPARVTAMRGDDTFSFGLEGRLALTGDSLASFIGDGVLHGLEAGRPQPLGGVWGNLVIAVFGDARAAYKLLLVALTVGCAALLYALVRQLGGTRPVAAMVVVLLAGAVQFRAYHDPMLGYYGTTQVALACALGSLLLMLHGRTAWAVVVFAAAVMLYETAAPLALAHLALAATRGRARAAIPFLATAFAFVAYGFVVRTLTDGGDGGGYAVGYDAGAIVSTYFEQLVPPLPGANVLFGDGALFARPTAPELAGAAWRAAAVGAAVAWVGLRHAGDELRLLPMAATGAALIAAPVLLIAMAEKYQHELSLATGYLPVIMQSFGWALLAGAAVLALGRRSRPAVVVAAAVLAAGAALSGYDVVRVAATEVPRATVNDALVHAAGRGALDAVPAGATVLLVESDMGSGMTGWGERHMLDAVLREQTGRRYDGRHHPAAGVGTCPADPDAAIPRDCGPVAARAAWVRAGASRGQAAVTVATFAGPGTTGAPVTALAAYVEGASLAPPELTATAADGTPWSGSGQPWRRARSGGGWALYRLTPSAPAPVADTIALAGRTIDLAAPVAAADRVRELGTARVLP